MQSSFILAVTAWGRAATTRPVASSTCAQIVRSLATRRTPSCLELMQWTSRRPDESYSRATMIMPSTCGTHSRHIALPCCTATRTELAVSSVRPTAPQSPLAAGTSHWRYGLRNDLRVLTHAYMYVHMYRTETTARADFKPRSSTSTRCT